MCRPDLSPPVWPGVKQACCEFLDSQLDPSNCLGIRDFAETHGCADLVRAAEVFSQKHFPEVVQHEEFILLGQGEVEKLIKCDEIQVGRLGPGQGATALVSRRPVGRPEGSSGGPGTLCRFTCMFTGGREFATFPNEIPGRH